MSRTAPILPPPVAPPSAKYVAKARTLRKREAAGAGPPPPPVADGAVRGEVPSFSTQERVLQLPESQAYLEAATAIDGGKFLAYGTTFCCCSPSIIDNPLYDVQLMANSFLPQNGASMCPSSYNALCAAPCTACCIGCAGFLNQLQGIEYENEWFETQEDALAALLAIPANPDVPEQIAGVWGFYGNPWGEQIISLSTLDWQAETRVLRGDHIFVREGWVERGDACGAFQQCIMSTGCQPGLFILFKDDSLHNARIYLTLDPVCCPGSCFWAPCAKACGTGRFPCATGVGYCLAIPQFINENTFTVIGGSEAPAYNDWRNRQIGACSLPLTCCNLSYTTRKLAHRNGARLARNWELYTKWIEARAGTLKGMRMRTQPYGPYSNQPALQQMERA